MESILSNTEVNIYKSAIVSNESQISEVYIEPFYILLDTYYIDTPTVILQQKYEIQKKTILLVFMCKPLFFLM
jgi:acyl-[acyl carrier protein]--UDP-N-acetylglucosamine O-acyltransferase